MTDGGTVARRAETPTVTGTLLSWWRPPAPPIRAGVVERGDALSVLDMALQNQQLTPGQYDARAATARKAEYRHELSALLADLVEPADMPRTLRPPERPRSPVGSWRLWSAFTLVLVSGVATAAYVDKAQTSAELTDLLRRSNAESREMREEFGREVDSLQQQLDQQSDRLNRAEQDNADLRQRTRDLERKVGSPIDRAPVSPADPGLPFDLDLPGALGDLRLDGATRTLPAHGVEAVAATMRTSPGPVARRQPLGSPARLR